MQEQGDVFEVVVRFRPLNEREKRELREYAVANPLDEAEDELEHTSVASLLKLYTSTTFEFDGKAYTFDRVFGCDTSQAQLYDAIIGPLVSRFVEQPHDATIIAYGQTSSGKTWTIDGDWYTSGSGGGASNEVAEQITPGAGVLPRALMAIFASLDTPEMRQRRLLVEFSFYEIYCDRIVDLLQPSGAVVQLFDDRKTGKVFMKNLTWATVRTVGELLSRLFECRERRHYAYTAMNANSSRSHTIFDLRLSTRESRAGDVASYKNFRVVDLAGSERASRTKASGVTFEEGKKINQSLMDLRSVIAQLSRPSAGSGSMVVNHRASKLTRILYPSFRGGSRVVVLACCSPALDSRSETYGTLQFACHAKRISLKLDDLKPVEAAAGARGGAVDDRVREMAEEAAERERRIEAYKAEMEELRALVARAKICAACGGSNDQRFTATPPTTPTPPVRSRPLNDAATQTVAVATPLLVPQPPPQPPQPPPPPLTCDADYSTLSQRYFVLLERERERTRRYKATVDMQRKMLQQKIADNEMLDQELQMLRMLKNVILQEF